MKRIIKSFLLVVAILQVINCFSQTKIEPERVNNIVLVHGAFVDGSGWEPVYNILVEKGYKVSVTQHTLQSLETDIDAVNRIINQQDGPCILVGHSYGGVVISGAGMNSKVAGLVYIAAHAPEANEKRSELFKKFPPAYTSLIKGKDGYDYIDPEKFPADFAADMAVKKARFMADAQPATADICFQGLIDNPAWKIKPSWYMVAGLDRIINPGLEHFYAKRMNARKTIEIKEGSHSIFTTRPKEVASLIEDAALNAQK